jgi:hypothetical protein
MRARALIAVSAVVAMAGALLLAAGPAALGKDNVKARLLTPLRVDAAPGERLTVVWALAGADEHGRRLPFNAIGVLVRLLSASGGRPTTGRAAAPGRVLPVWPALAGALGLLGVVAAMIWRGRGGLPWRVRRVVDDRGGEAAVSSSQPPSPH